jgi:hypothetical protein
MRQLAHCYALFSYRQSFGSVHRLFIVGPYSNQRDIRNNNLLFSDLRWCRFRYRGGLFLTHCEIRVWGCPTEASCSSYRIRLLTSSIPLGLISICRSRTTFLTLYLQTTDIAFSNSLPRPSIYHRPMDARPTSPQRTTRSRRRFRLEVSQRAVLPHQSSRPHSYFPLRLCECGRGTAFEILTSDRQMPQLSANAQLLRNGGSYPCSDENARFAQLYACLGADDLGTC